MEIPKKIIRTIVYHTFLFLIFSIHSMDNTSAGVRAIASTPSTYSDVVTSKPNGILYKDNTLVVKMTNARNVDVSSKLTAQKEKMIIEVRIKELREIQSVLREYNYAAGHYNRLPEKKDFLPLHQRLITFTQACFDERTRGMAYIFLGYMHLNSVLWDPPLVIEFFNKAETFDLAVHDIDLIAKYRKRLFEKLETP